MTIGEKFMAQRSVMVVEDEYVLARDLANRLEQFGYQVCGPASQGAAALELAGQCRPDLVLMDIRLGGDLDGIATAVELRRRLDVPVVFLTAFADDDTLERAKVAEPHGYLLKPCEDRELRTVIEMSLARHDAEVSRRAAEAQARQLANEQRIILESAPIGILFVRDGKVQWANPALEDLVGWERGSGQGREVARIFGRAESIERLQANAQVQPAGETAFSQEIEICRQDSSVFWCQLVGRAVNPSDPAQGSIWMLTDVSDRKRMQEAIQRSQALYRAVARNLPDSAVFLVDPQLRYQMAEGTLLAKAGLSTDRIEGRTPMEVFDASRGPLIEERFRRALAGETASYQTLHSGFNVWTQYVPLRDTSGQVTAALSLAMDLTEHKRVESALAESEARLRMALAAARMGVWEWNLPNNTVFCSVECREVTGSSEFRGTLNDFLGLLHPDEASSTIAALEQATRDRKPFAMQSRIVRPNGQPGWVSLTARATYDAGGQPLTVVGTIQDITQRKLLEEHLHQSQKLEGIGHLAGGIAHELNNILAAMLLNLNLLHESAGDDDTREALKDVDSLANRAAGIVRQLLIFSRQSPMQPRPLDLADTIGSMMPLLRRICGSHIELSFSARGHLSLVQADPDMVEQMVMNLMLNARDALPQGGVVRVELEPHEIDANYVKRHRESRPGRFLCVAIVDNGCGMDGATLNRLFEPFFSTKDVGRGVGMGLAAAYGIARQHSGWIEVESQVGRGSTFRVFLPVLTSDVVATATAPGKLPARGGGETLLVVDDELPFLKAVSQVLRHLGYRVLEARASEEAMAIWQEHKADIALLYADMSLPGGMSGLELSQRMRLERPELKVILASGYHARLAELVKLADRVVCLPKPVPVDLLTTTLRQSLDQA